MFYWNTNFKNVVVELSGGADSSLLYYFVAASYPDANIYVITLVTDKKPFYVDSSKRVISKVKELTGKEPTEHIFVHGSHKEYTDLLNNAVQDAIKKYNVDIVYTGISVNSDHQQIRDWVKINQFRYNIDYDTAMYHIDKRDKKRDTRPDYDVVSTLPPDFQTLYNSPWAHKDKHLIADLYKEYGVLETLFPYTISCANYTDETYTTLEEHKHCGYKCFPCLERWEAFGRLD